MDVFLLQGIYLLLIVIITSLGVFLPLCFLVLKYSDKSPGQAFPEATQRWFSLANSYSSGVFLGMCFLGLLPAAENKWAQALAALAAADGQHGQHGQHDKPYGQLVMVAGFAGIFVIQQTLAEAYKVMAKKQKKEGPRARSQSRGRSDEARRVEHCPLNDDDGDDVGDEGATFLEAKFSPHSNFRSSVTPAGAAAAATKEGKESEYASIAPIFTPSKSGSSLDKPLPASHAHCASAAHLVVETVRSALWQVGGPKIFLLLLGVSWHNAFEGLSLGLQADVATLTTLFLGIVIHGFLLSAAVSIMALSAWLPMQLPVKLMVLYLGTLTLMRPVGIVLGMLIQSSDSLLLTFLSAMLQSLSTGLFIYIIFFSLIPEEFSSTADFSGSGSVGPATLRSKLIAFNLGWTSFAAITFVLNGHHVG